MRPAFLFLAASVALLGVMYARSAVPVVDNTATEDAADTPNGGDVGGWTDEAAQAADQANPVALMEQNTVNNDSQNDNVRAFLQMIQTSEGTAHAADPYAVCYGYRHTVQDFADHPAILGEWGGESIANLGPEYAGKVSTAAGAYQIIRPTWKGCKRALALPDFSPPSQDAAAIWIIREAGALDAVKAGDFDQAVSLCAKQWASLPGANAPGQGMRRLSDLRTAYVQAGGTVA